MTTYPCPYCKFDINHGEDYCDGCWNYADLADFGRLYVVVRNDLRPGQQAVQAMHALASFAHEQPNHFDQWQEDGNVLILLQTPNLDTLKGLDTALGCLQVDYSVFREPDMDYEPTAIAIEPTPYANGLLTNFKLALPGDRTAWTPRWKRWLKR